MVKALKYRLKADLVDMATLLAIDEPASLRRDDLEERVRTRLLERRSELENDDYWSPIYHTIDAGERRAARGSMRHSAESEDSDAPSRSRSPRKSAGKAAANGLATPLRKTSDALSTSASTMMAEAQSIYPALQARGKRSLESIGNMFKAGAAETRAEVSDAAHEVEARGEAVAHAVKRQQRAAVRKTHKAWRDVGLYASDARNLTTVLVGLEFAALLLSIIPTRDISLGSSSAFASSWSVPVPSLWVLFVPAFWRVLLIWGFWTVAVPTFLSQLITFDRRRAASIQTFTLARFFLILALVRISPHLGLGARQPPAVLGVAAGQVPFGAATEHALTGWSKIVSYDWVSAAVGPDLQLINAAAAASFALYEAIAVRPRSI